MIEVWNGVFFGLEDLCALLEEIVARKQDLSPVVAGVGVVVALFDDGEDGVDGDAARRRSAELRECCGRGGSRTAERARG